MPQINRSALMPYSAQTMYDVVNDVSRYPEFLPWCGGAKILSESETLMEASVYIKKGSVKHWFSTKNNLVTNRSIEMHLTAGPFKRLDGLWEFIALNDQACKIKLDLNFEFSNGVAGKLLTPIFSYIANTMVDSFCDRASELNAD